jgi:hypothetical protein
MYIISGFGRNLSFVMQELIKIFKFSKDKSPELSIARNKINSNSDFLMSYPSIT